MINSKLLQFIASFILESETQLPEYLSRAHDTVVSREDRLRSHERLKMSVKTAQAILALRQTLPHAHLVTPGTTNEYKTLDESYLSGFESDLSPAWIFLLKSKEEVAAFVRTIRPSVSYIQFAVRAAGRQPLPGCANVQDGITVDL